MIFEYEAVPIGRRGWGEPAMLKGKKRRGMIEAPTGELAILKLMQRKLYPLSLKSMSQRDVSVATRLKNFKSMKAALTGADAPNSPAPRSRISWATIRFYLAWGVGIIALLWAISRS
jgi:hypothetical protein